MATILVAEDNDDLRYIIRDILIGSGHTVIEACDGSEVSDLLDKNTVDLLITDIVMPEQEGIQTIVFVHRQFPAVRIIAMSGGGSLGGADYYLDMAKSFGADAILEKPFAMAKLKQIVAAILTLEVVDGAP